MFKKIVETSILVLVLLLPVSSFCKEKDIYRYFQTGIAPLPIKDSVRVENDVKYICYTDWNNEFFVEQRGKGEIRLLTYHTLSENLVEELISDFTLVNSSVGNDGYSKDYYLGDYLLLVVKRSRRDKYIELQFSIK